MTTIGADNFADAPYLELGTSSAYTPNAGYTLEVDEPAAWGGKTAWWRFTSTVDAFVYLDVLWSTGSTRAWAYRGFTPTPDFGDLLLVSDAGADTQGGFNAGAGNTYWIRADSDGSDVSYVISIGADVYDEITTDYPLTGARLEPDPDILHENYFESTAVETDSGSPWYTPSRDIIAAAVDGAPGLTPGVSYAEMKVGEFAQNIIDEYPGYHSGLSWYGDPPDTTYGHPIITFAVSSEGNAPIETPDGYGLSGSRLVVVMSSGGVHPFRTDASSNVDRIIMDGAFNTAQDVRYTIDGTPQNTPGDDFTVPGTLTEFTFDKHPSFSSPDFEYNNGTLEVLIIPNLEGTEADPVVVPSGTWRISYVALRVLFQSDDPLPYEPPGPPVLAVITVVRQFPRDDAYGWDASPRIYPPPRSQRIIGGHQ